MRLELLPKWVYPDSSPSLYDTESVTALEGVSKLHAKMNELVTDYNKFADLWNNQIMEFDYSTTEELKVFEASMRQEFQDFIDVINLKYDSQEGRIDSAINKALADIEDQRQRLLTDIEIAGDIVQTTGQSESAVMSQKAVTKRVTAMQDNIDSFAININLFNTNDERNIMNKFISGSGEFSDEEHYRISHPIQVYKGKSYKTPFNKGGYGSVAVCRVEDEEGNKIKKVNGVLNDEGTFVVFTFEEDCLVRFNAGNAKRFHTVFMVCEVEKYPETFIPYGFVIKGTNVGDVNNLNTTNKTNLVEAINEVNEKTTDTSNNVLVGKKISFNGDSICAGAGFTGGYAKIIADRNSMTYQNIAVGGATITAEQYSTSGNARHWICRTIENMDEDADYAIVEGGVNDSSLGLPLGTLSEGYNATLDDTTFYGAFESMLKQLVSRFAEKKIGYIAVHKMTNGFNASKADDSTSYYWAAKKCCEKWGVPFLDLNTAVPAFAFFNENGNADLYALRTTYTHNGDGWHPNEAGYKKYYCDKIEEWLKTL